MKLFRRIEEWDVMFASIILIGKAAGINKEFAEDARKLGYGAQWLRNQIEIMRF